MINKLRLLGEIIQENEGDANALGLNLDLRDANVILLCFKLEDDFCEFTETDVLEYDQSKSQKILYRKAGAQTKSPFPTYNAFYDKDETKRRNNIEKSMNKFLVTLDNNSKINTLLEPLVQFLKNEENVELIQNAIYDNLSPDKSNLFTIKINGLLPGDSDLFRPVIQHHLGSKDETYFFKYNTKSVGAKEKCYACNKSSDLLYGFCDTFKFYSANEDAYIAGGFQKEKSWINYPICPSCASSLRLGREKIQKSFNRYFYGNKYFLIPSPILEMRDYYSFLQDIEEDLKDLSLRKEHETNQQIRNEMEDHVFDTLAKQKNQATFTIFFYAESNSEFKILQEAEDILPSRFRTITEAKKWVEQCEEFKNLKGLYKKGETADLSFNFGIIKTFFPSHFNNDFLDITTKILKGQKINKAFILHQISEHLARGFRNKQLYHDIEKAMIFLKFLYELKLIDQTNDRMEVNMENKYEVYFKLHPEFYNSDWKKAVFLMGVIAQHVIDYQQSTRGAKPFRSRLNGLKLDQKAIKRLLPESIEKLDQYKANYYRDLEEVIARLMESGEPDLKMQSVDEISFYFAMGMNLNKQFKLKQEKEEKNDE